MIEISNPLLKDKQFLKFAECASGVYLGFSRQLNRKLSGYSATEQDQQRLNNRKRALSFPLSRSSPRLKLRIPIF